MNGAPGNNKDQYGDSGLRLRSGQNDVQKKQMRGFFPFATLRVRMTILEGCGMTKETNTGVLPLPLHVVQGQGQDDDSISGG